jgi:hypothetical protein
MDWRECAGRQDKIDASRRRARAVAGGALTLSIGARTSTLIERHTRPVHAVRVAWNRAGPNCARLIGPWW